MNYPKKSKEQILNEVKKIYQDLEDGLRNLFHSEDYIHFLNTMANRLNYSYQNMILIFLQKPDATFIAGYKTFLNKYGHQVQAGEKGIKILAPIIYHKEKNENQMSNLIHFSEEIKEQDKSKDEYLAGFRTINVFDISQTKPIKTTTKAGIKTISPKAQQLIKDLSYLSLTEIWAEDDKYIDDLTNAIKKAIPVPIQYKPLNKKINGFLSLKDEKNLYIVLNSNFGSATLLTTLIHEWSHYKLHNPYNTKYKSYTRQEREIQAESITYVVMKHFGINCDCESIKYIASWSKTNDTKVLKESIKIIQKTSVEIIAEVENILLSKGYHFPSITCQKII